MKSNQVYQAIEFIGPYKRLSTGDALVQISYAVSPNIEKAYTFLRDEDIVDIECSDQVAAILATHIKDTCKPNMVDYHSGLQILDGYLAPIHPPQTRSTTGSVKQEEESVNIVNSQTTVSSFVPVPENQKVSSNKRKIAVAFVLIPLLAFIGQYVAVVSQDAFFVQDFDVDEIARLSLDKTIVITGASSGLGFSSTKLLAIAGTAKVIVMGCRNIQKCERAKEEILTIMQHSTSAGIGGEEGGSILVPLHLDLKSIVSVQKFATQVQEVLRDYSHGGEVSNQDEEYHPKLDILMNNAGIMGVPYEIANDTGAEMQMHVNHLAHFALTSFLSQNLVAGSRIVSVSSLAGALSDWLIHFLGRILPQTLQSIPAYAASKRANIKFTNAFNRRFASSGVEAVLAHPGYSRTSITSNWSFAPKALRQVFSKNIIGSMSADVGALSQLRAALDVDNVKSDDYVGPLFYVVGRPIVVGSSTKSFHHCALKGDEDGDILWQHSEEVVSNIIMS